MDAETLKTQVKSSFANVESGDFLQLKVEQQAEMHRRECRQYLIQNPHCTFEQWKQEKEASVNVESPDDIMAKGIYLLALDELNYDNI